MTDGDEPLVALREYISTPSPYLALLPLLLHVLPGLEVPKESGNRIWVGVKKVDSYT